MQNMPDPAVASDIKKILDKLEEMHTVEYKEMPHKIKDLFALYTEDRVLLLQAVWCSV